MLPLLGCPEKTQRDDVRPPPSAQAKEAHAMKPKDDSCQTAKTARAFVEQAREELGPGMAGAELAPVLPSHWPPKGGGLEYFVCRSESLPTGLVKSEVRGPTERIHFATPGATPRVESFGNVAVLGVEDTTARESLNPPQNQIERAEQALLDVVAGCRSLEAARGDLEGYLEWVAQNPLQGRDLERRGDRLFSWLRRR
ncbi:MULTISPECIES: hypothetical protein [unclassified Corallococcus]|uniref:hypothetical protein n=1 Tax=unclassified Corallococcus TaxID=2685029 RepID=UPI001A8D2A64|nr:MULTISPECIES: hypothetical protein [unclassified Corallococcus]MBN9685946.1 hypothetical protein [Corallococcus sp. NCSPR001]WAS82614.1 hypothetical protein O0N60_25200 [Corallococcus sp. NCRR]